MDCPLCDKTHEVEERKRLATITMKGEKVAYEEKFYFCENASDDENEFETGSMMNENLCNARKKIEQTIHRIPFLITKTEIIEQLDKH